MEPTVVGIVHQDDRIRHELSERIEGEEGLILAAAGAALPDLTLPSSRYVLIIGGEAAIRLARMKPPSFGACVVVSSGSIAEARAALRLGASDILRWPQEQDLLPGAVRQSASEGSGLPETQRGRVIAVAGARGGLGTTTLACWIAKELSADLLVQVDGSGSLSELGDHPAPGLEPLIRGVTGPAIRSISVELRNGQRALYADPDAHEISDRELDQILRTCRRLGVVVVDAGRLDMRGRSVLRAATESIVVTADEVGCARTTAEAQIGEFRWIRRRWARRSLRFPVRDLENLMGGPPIMIVRHDPRVAHARDLGRLAPAPPGLAAALSGSVSRRVARGSQTALRRLMPAGESS